MSAPGSSTPPPEAAPPRAVRRALWVLGLCLVPLVGLGGFLLWCLWPALQAHEFGPALPCLMLIIFTVAWPFVAIYRGLQRAKRPLPPSDPPQPQG